MPRFQPTMHSTELIRVKSRRPRTVAKLAQRERADPTPGGGQSHAVAVCCLPLAGGFQSAHILQANHPTLLAKENVMNSLTTNEQAATGYELRFRSLFDEGRGFSFPCDRAGTVDMDALSDRARNNYFFAHSVIGREVAMPSVLPCAIH